MADAKPIPLAVLKPLSTSLWKYDDYSQGKFATMTEWHRDRETNCACAYFLRDDTDGELLTLSEFKAIVKAGAVDPAFHYQTGVNQHWLHSLEQFYAVVYKEWRAHEARTKALLGTPSGRIYRSGRDE